MGDKVTIPREATDAVMVWRPKSEQEVFDAMGGDSVVEFLAEGIASADMALAKVASAVAGGDQEEISEAFRAAMANTRILLYGAAVATVQQANEAQERAVQIVFSVASAGMFNAVSAAAEGGAE